MGLPGTDYRLVDGTPVQSHQAFLDKLDRKDRAAADGVRFVGGGVGGTNRLRGVAVGVRGAARPFAAGDAQGAHAGCKAHAKKRKAARFRGGGSGGRKGQAKGAAKPAGERGDHAARRNTADGAAAAVCHEQVAARIKGEASGAVEPAGEQANRAARRNTADGVGVQV